MEPENLQGCFVLFIEYVCMHTSRSCEQGSVLLCIWRPEVDNACHSQSVSILLRQVLLLNPELGDPASLASQLARDPITTSPPGSFYRN